MKEILREISCYQNMGGDNPENNTSQTSVRPPQLPILQEAWIAHRLAPEVKVPVKVLLDTGNDMTVIMPQVVEKLEVELAKWLAVSEMPHNIPIPFQEEYAIEYWGQARNEEEFRQLQVARRHVQPTFDLTLFLTAEDNYSSTYGLLAPNTWDFQGVEVWLGQDIFSQLIVTFDGVNKKVTIKDPAKS